jgi:pyrimidine operon attenuation protein / uracil phosphoribosyltransferase
MPTRFDAAEIANRVDSLVSDICACFHPDKPLTIVGIRTGGELLAERIARKLTARGYTHLRRGVLDITLYRDDLSEIGPRPLVRSTEIAVDISAIPLLLVDDVLFTGRSVRAALDQLTDFGRPSAIRLAVLVDRGGRELPIQPDFTGLLLRDVPNTHTVNVRLAENPEHDIIAIEPLKTDPA